MNYFIVCSEGCLVTVGSDSLIRLTGLDQERERALSVLQELFGVQSEVSDRHTAGHQADEQTAEHQADEQTAGHQADKQTAGHQADKQTAGHQADKQTAGHQADGVFKTTYSLLYIFVFTSTY